MEATAKAKLTVAIWGGVAVMLLLSAAFVAFE
jgi:hypothetical protein